ncbi:MAG: HAD-IA family hydrolase [Parcubacteria group bacterium]
MKTKNANRRMILFDFDGTIADSFKEMMEIFNEVADEYGYDKIKEDNVLLLRNLSSQELIKKFDIPKWKLPFVIRKAKKIFNRRMPSIAMADGMRELLRRLKDQNYYLGILTSNSEKNVRDFLERQEIDVFDAVFSESSLFGKSKALKKIMRRFGLKPREVVYIGDETRDIEAAKKSGAAAVAVCWGFNSKKILKRYAPDHIADQPDDLLKYLDVWRRL